MKSRSLHLMLLVGSALLLAACERQIAEIRPPDGTARLRLVHGSAETAALNLVVDGQVLVNGLAPTGISPYTELAAGDHQVKIGLTGSGGTLLQRQITLDEGKDYSFLVSGSLASPEGMLASDTAGIPLPGKVKIRIVHAARNAPPLDVYLTAPGADLSGQGTVVEPFEFGVDTANFPGFVERDPGDYEVRFTQDGTTNVVLGTGTFHAAAGQVLTVVLSHDEAGGLVTRVIDETPGPAASGAFVRVVHAAPTAGPVAVHVTAPGDDLSQPHLFIAPFVYGQDSSTVTFLLPAPGGSTQLEVRFTGVSDLDVLASSGAFDAPAGEGRRVTLQPGPADQLEAVVTPEP